MKSFTATGADADTTIESVRLRLEADAAKTKMQRERDEALQREAAIRTELERMQKIATGAIAILILIVTVIGLAVLNDATSPPSPSRPPSESPPAQPSPPSNPPQITKPPRRPDVPSRRCTRGCGPPDCCEYPSWRFHTRPKYQDFECWRDRSIQGPCFD